MPIQLSDYHAEGPFSNTEGLKYQSGVYAILGRNGQGNWSVVDVGESNDVRTRVSSHDREPCWKRQPYAELAFAAIYCDEAQRMRIEKELRDELDPPCGKV